MTILVTGAGGFIGSHVADKLVQDGYNVVGLDNFSTGRNENVTDFFANGGVIEVADIRDEKSLDEIFGEYKPERVIHLAAQSAISTSWEDPKTDMEINARGTLNMLHACNRHGVKKFVLASTSAVYREKDAPKVIRESWDRYPGSPYGASKLAAEVYTRQMFQDSIILRFGNVYGPRQVPVGGNQMIAIVMDYFTNPHSQYDFKVYGDGEQTRDYIYVRDIVDIVIRSAFADHERATFNAATGKAKSVNYILTQIEKLFGVVGYQWEHTKRQDPRRNVCMNIDYMKKRMNWKPHWSIKDGLKETAQWWLDRRNGYG